MNTKDFLRLGVPLGEATRRATDFVCQFILGGGDKSRLREGFFRVLLGVFPPGTVQVLATARRR